mmetsp:Transcript_146364/g.258589  ORF Transcript_146364/g.258589 Transcript_146364/m.258589 type:complete len:246 (+) Transcript_146364:112-849(+)
MPSMTRYFISSVRRPPIIITWHILRPPIIITWQRPWRRHPICWMSRRHVHLHRVGHMRIHVRRMMIRVPRHHRHRRPERPHIAGMHRRAMRSTIRRLRRRQRQLRLHSSMTWVHAPARWRMPLLLLLVFLLRSLTSFTCPMTPRPVLYLLHARLIRTILCCRCVFSGGLLRGCLLHRCLLYGCRGGRDTLLCFLIPHLCIWSRPQAHLFWLLGLGLASDSRLLCRGPLTPIGFCNLLISILFHCT